MLLEGRLLNYIHSWGVIQGNTKPIERDSRYLRVFIAISTAVQPSHNRYSHQLASKNNNIF